MDSYLPLVELTYNNNYYSSTGMTPFKALYGRMCKTPLCWYELGENVVLGLEIIQQIENQDDSGKGEGFAK